MSNNIKFTNGGFRIVTFERKANPVSRGVLEPLIYEGFVELSDNHPMLIEWDRFGRCSNLQREDCFVDLKKLADWIEPISEFNVYTVDKQTENSWTHWSDGLKMYIVKNGVTIVLESNEIEELVKTLPRTFGGKY